MFNVEHHDFISHTDFSMGNVCLPIWKKFVIEKLTFSHLIKESIAFCGRDANRVHDSPPLVSVVRKINSVYLDVRLGVLFKAKPSGLTIRS